MADDEWQMAELLRQTHENLKISWPAGKDFLPHPTVTNSVL